MKKIKILYRKEEIDDPDDMVNKVLNDIKYHGIPCTATGVDGLRLWINDLRKEYTGVRVDGNELELYSVYTGDVFLRIRVEED